MAKRKTVGGREENFWWFWFFNSNKLMTVEAVRTEMSDLIQEYELSKPLPPFYEEGYQSSLAKLVDRAKALGQK